MNIKSFFNVTVLKKDLTRFLPLWVIYLILGLMVFMTTMGDMYFTVAEFASNSLSWLSVVTMIYALITAQMLFGELFQSKLCNAIHALPVRREGLFISHFTAGLIMNLGPNLVIALFGMLALKRLWFVALLWWLAMSLQYLIFFGMAVFCMHCAGNRFAAVAIYTLLNFISLVIMVYFTLFYKPMLYGLEMNNSLRGIFYLFTPVVKLASDQDWFSLTHLPNCIQHWAEDSFRGSSYNCQYVFSGFGDTWGYLILAAVAGIGFAVAAFFIYRKRHMESAGDFVSFKPMGTFFTLLASASLALLLHAVLPTVGMVVGALVGFFVCRMLLERTIKVFNKKSWLYLIGLCLFMGATFILTAFDVFGVVTRIPDVEDVQSVTIADTYLGDWRLEDLSAEPQEDGKIVLTGADPYYQYAKDGMMTLTLEKQILDIQQIHKLLIEEGNARKDGTRNYYTITIHYKLKNGSTLTRYYYTDVNSEAMQRLQTYITTSQFILGFEGPEAMVKFLRYAYYYGVNHSDGLTIEDPEWLEKLAYALFADAEEGYIQPNSSQYDGELNLEFEYEDGLHGGQFIALTYQAKNTLMCLRDYETWAKENGKMDP